MTGHTDGPSDQRLGGALRDLEVPDHRHGFYVTVQDAVEREHHERNVVQLPLAPAARGPQRTGHALWRFAAAAAVVTVVAVSTVLVGLPTQRPHVATAAEVRARVLTSWAQTDSITGQLIVDNRRMFGPGERRWAFTLTGRGDIRLEDRTRGGDLAYDAERNVERSLSVSESVGDQDAQFASQRRGLAPGWPDQGPAGDILERHLGATVRALAASEDGTVEEIEYEGRRAWNLETDVGVNQVAPNDSPDHLAITVDQESGFPLRVTATNNERTLYTVRIEDLQINPEIPDGVFRLQFPAGMEVFRSDIGFRRVTMERAADRVGYSPLAPAWVPDGYELADVAASRQPSPTGTEAANPAVKNIVALSYRRGLDHFIVTTRPAGPDPAVWEDPLATGEGHRDEPEPVMFSAGALAGEEGEVVINPLGIPHVWAVTDRLVVTVSGDLTRSELIGIAESLR